MGMPAHRALGFPVDSEAWARMVAASSTGQRNNLGPRISAGVFQPRVILGR
jgi:hypothetical protein